MKTLPRRLHVAVSKSSHRIISEVPSVVPNVVPNVVPPSK